MDLSEFVKSLEEDHPPSDWSVHLRGLWYDRKGEWNRAHDIIDGHQGKDAAWIHAYLHRVEGDQWNADYWYRQAGKVRSELTLQEESDMLVEHFLAR